MLKLDINRITTVAERVIGRDQTVTYEGKRVELRAHAAFRQVRADGMGRRFDDGRTPGGAQWITSARRSTCPNSHGIDARWARCGI